jgi:hypothetical protein
VSEDFYNKGKDEVMKAIKVYEEYKKSDFDVNEFLIKGTL